MFVIIIIKVSYRKVLIFLNNFNHYLLTLLLTDSFGSPLVFRIILAKQSCLNNTKFGLEIGKECLCFEGINDFSVDCAF